MATFDLSPDVQSFELDITAIIPSVATSDGGIAGIFPWGPINQIVQVSDEKSLVRVFGKPTNLNPETFFTAANFLSYATSLYVVRTANTSGAANNITNTVLNAVAGTNGNTVPSNTILLTGLITNANTYANVISDASLMYVAKYPGTLGNSLLVSVCDSVSAYGSTLNLTPNTDFNVATTSISFTIGSNVATVFISPSGTGTGVETLAIANNVANTVIIGDILVAGNASIGTQNLVVTNVGTPTQAGSNTTLTINLASNFNLGTNYSSNTVSRQWQFYKTVSKAPGTSPWQAAAVGANNTAVDQLHIVVQDQDGLFTGTPGTILEVWNALSRGTDAVDDTLNSTYYKTVINNQSNYIWFANDRAGSPSNTAIGITSSTNVKPFTTSFVGGQDGLSESTVPLSTLTAGYDFFTSGSAVDISILLGGRANGGTYGEALPNYIIGNIAEARKDCVFVCSPAANTVVNNAGNEVTSMVAFRNAVTPSSYAIMDSGYKYQFDKYNNVYRYIPLNGDIGGIIARTDLTNDAWWSPAGYNRGILKNVIRLAFNPVKKADRNTLFSADINPVVLQPNSGPVLLGDKTLIGTTSAFNAINVRRLFIVLRKAITIASRALLFEFNDAFTQAQFVSMVDPFLRNIQGRRGITAYNIDAGPDVNTPFVVDSNGFIGLVQVKPARAIRFINLYFQAVNDGVDFTEVAGAF